MGWATATSRSPFDKKGLPPSQQQARAGEPASALEGRLFREQAHDRFSRGDALDRLTDQRGHGQLADLAAALGRLGSAESVLVTTTSSSAEPCAMRSMAGPEKMGCVQ